ncbi:MAG: DNA polymerase ligase N-terminal domain-containing protein [Acidimicrobiales bacterium]
MATESERDSLDEYRAKRDFARTPEPAGARPKRRPKGAPRFVLQQHDATRLHWDLRLERDGALPSWALPRGVPWHPDRNHLAVHTEDHPLEYLTFEGDIPEGEYGAGRMFVWDTGWYETEKWTSSKMVVVLHGERAQGRYALFQTKGRDWMIHRMDPPADPTREPVPTDLRPMLAVPGDLPADEGWAFEVRWSGERALVAASTGAVDVTAADGSDISEAFPEVRRIGRALGSTEVVLDTVLVGSGEGRASIDRRLGARSDSVIRRLARDQPAAAVVVDLLWIDGHPVIDVPWSERRQALDDLALDGPAWRTPSAHHGDGEALLDAARTQRLSGLVAKRVDALYQPGQRSDDWVDIGLGG